MNHGDDRKPKASLFRQQGIPMAVAVCKEALLRRRLVVLCDLQEIALLIEQEADIRAFLRKKIQAAIVNKNPYYSPV